MSPRTNDSLQLTTTSKTIFSSQTIIKHRDWRGYQISLKLNGRIVILISL